MQQRAIIPQLDVFHRTWYNFIITDEFYLYSPLLFNKMNIIAAVNILWGTDYITWMQ